MTKEEQKIFLEGFQNEMKSLILSKGDDYAGNVDRLSNFKVVGAIQKIDPKQVALTMMSVKIARIATLIAEKNGNVKHESIKDSLVDLANYSALMAMLIQDEEANAAMS